MDEPVHQATLYIKDTDDNPSMAEIHMMTNPIEEIICRNNSIATRTFLQVNVIQELPQVMDGEFLVHPLMIHYENYS